MSNTLSVLLIIGSAVVLSGCNDERKSADAPVTGKRWNFVTTVPGSGMSQIGIGGPGLFDTKDECVAWASVEIPKRFVDSKSPIDWFCMSGDYVLPNVRHRKDLEK